MGLMFGYLAVVGSRRVKVKRRDWLAAAAMSAGVGLFLFLASPSGGRLHAPGSESSPSTTSPPTRPRDPPEPAQEP